MESSVDWQTLSQKIKTWGLELGFAQIGICDTDLSVAEAQLHQWLDVGYHGEMSYLQRHAELRSHPEQLLPGTIRVIMGRMNYLPPEPAIKKTLRNQKKGYISRYALGGDYHKLIRKKMAQLAKKIETEIGPFTHRAFADSAPVLEKPLAIKAGLGWQGKNTLVLNKEEGSYFFLGTLYTSLPLAIDEVVVENGCSTCSACIKICPTQAIVQPYVLNASRCISYLTIELRGSIPEEFRTMIGNRIFGCDDCQLCCPWNRFAKTTDQKTFHPRHHLNDSDLLTLFNWSETEFLERTIASPIRRIGYEGWLRNIAVALGNADYDEQIVTVLNEKLISASELVCEHIQWALLQQKNKKGALAAPF